MYEEVSSVVEWSRTAILGSLEEFKDIYDGRPIKDNRFGMKAPHLFGLWFMARALEPDLIVESGVWKGQSTWFLEQACPSADLISIDINLDAREYVSETATYSDLDFSEHDWDVDGDRTLVFFDDHQNGYRRIQQCHWMGFKHAIFDDNYPSGQGDCYSLKKAFAGSGHQAHPQASRGLRSAAFRATSRVAKVLATGTHQHTRDEVRPNTSDARLLRRHLHTYYEFPPLFRQPRTRWGDTWDDETYPTPEPILHESDRDRYPEYWEESSHYTWMCYARLR